MATVKLILERGRILKSGTYPIVFQIIHRRSKKLIYTPYRVDEREFNREKEQVVFITDDIRTKKEISAINSSIKNQRKCIATHILELDCRGCDYVVSEIVSRYRIENDTLSFLGYFDAQIQRKQEMNKDGTVRAYKYTRGSICKFMNYRHVRISDITPAFISEYERYLVKSEISANTICFHIRNFKTIYNQAIIDGYPTPDSHPFRYVQTKQRKTIKRALDRKNIVRIKELNLDNKLGLRLARDLFLFSFYSRGMAMVDMVFLTREKIKHRVMTYYRQKTSQCIEVAIIDELDEIINRYKDDSNYVFPILRDVSQVEHYRYYRLSVERTNRHLKKIGAMLELELPLTTYVARHSWATHAKMLGVSLSVISEGLGHTSENTTRIYLKAFDRSELDKANRQVAKLLR